jgi:ubiquitin-activating enzyme E1
MEVDKKHENSEVDESLYSRQLYVFGHEGQKRMASTHVLIVGLDGLGLEVAKNVILAGVSSCDLLDDAAVSTRDLGTHFYATQADVDAQRARAACSVTELQALNAYVDVRVVTGAVADALKSGKDYTIVVSIGGGMESQAQLNDDCRKHGAMFVCGAYARARVCVCMCVCV